MKLHLRPVGEASTSTAPAKPDVLIFTCDPVRPPSAESPSSLYQSPRLWAPLSLDRVGKAVRRRPCLGPTSLRAPSHLQSWRPYRLVKIRSSSFFSEPNEVFFCAVWGHRESVCPAELWDYERPGQELQIFGSPN